MQKRVRDAKKKTVDHLWIKGLEFRKDIINLLEAGKHHSTKFWYVRLYLIMMLIHMTSWDLQE